MTVRILSLLTAAALAFTGTDAQAMFPSTDMPILTFPDDGTRGTTKDDICLICEKDGI